VRAGIIHNEKMSTVPIVNNSADKLFAKLRFRRRFLMLHAMDARTLVEAMTLWEGTGAAVAQAAHAV